MFLFHMYNLGLICNRKPTFCMISFLNSCGYNQHRSILKVDLPILEKGQIFGPAKPLFRV